jgi:hypothetical protein
MEQTKMNFYNHEAVLREQEELPPIPAHTARS